ncbi:DNA methyltransferase [Planktothrix pseudagardhii]|uniref:site-specific DNA-methyltransferase (adenine-specific) n=1 Tax=Planktothrix pseudagardhii TaxID=132604 RepID=A0A9W4CPL9_9CYAN|nr:DNA methyltransferase [Planktothrix pseudagardhii]CAD5969115.1 Putative DNA methyltransferase YeeA [Planktothrix pseudagardhii]
MAATRESIYEFINFCEQHITEGRERQDSPEFLIKFFQAFGHKGLKEVNAQFDLPIPKSSQKGNMGFADLWWQRDRLGSVLIEMKSRKEKKLNKHYGQAWRYCQCLPVFPKYVILCNFDEFWIYDFSIQIDTPVDIITLQELPERLDAFKFMEFTPEIPKFRNNQVQVTALAARRMGELFQELKNRSKKAGFSEQTAQQFILQCVVAMFAQSRNLLPPNRFMECIDECMNGQSTYEVLSDGLFRHMNLPGVVTVGRRYKEVQYFNGGLFSVVHEIDLTRKELEYLKAAAEQDWSKVRPAIFGNIFEGTVNEEERHKYGIHFTSENDIMKIVYPTITEYWEERIEATTTIEELTLLHDEMANYRVLDPACGSGNFLYIAYQELKQTEQLLLDKLAEFQKSSPIVAGKVSPKQFYGIDNNPFAVELAKVTLLIARKIAIDKLGLTESALPLDTLDENITCKDALLNEWYPADAIIGNPPFLGGKHIRTQLGDQYIDQVFKRFSDVKDSVDFCAYWFRLAQDHLNENGRAGLVATNSISQGKSRIAALDYITQNGGYIYNAISTQPWSGEAAVHVSLVNWSKQKPQQYYLDNQEVLSINSSLNCNTDVSQAVRLSANLNQCFQGIIPVGMGFIVTENQVKEWIKADSKNQEVLKLFSMGANLAKNPHGLPDRWIIDFNDMTFEEASYYQLPFEHIQNTVKPERDKNRREVTKVNWWKFGEKRPAMRKALANLSYYFAVPEVSKWAIFIPCNSDWLSGNKTKVVVSEDFYILGILLSKVHRIWMHAQKSTLKADIAYTHNTCFETFPFPQKPNTNLVKQIRDTAIELHHYRTKQMDKNNWGITKLYNEYFDQPSTQLYQLHAKLDSLVIETYEFKLYDNILERLLTLNFELAEKEKQGESIIGPWVSN